MDPITLDPPVKFPPVPAPRAVTPPAPPKPDAKPDAKPEPAVPAAGGPPAPKAGGGKRKLLAGAAAALSLGVGAAAVRYWPGTPAADPAAADNKPDAKLTVPPVGGEPPKAEQRAATPAAPPRVPSRFTLVGVAIPYPADWRTGWRKSLPDWPPQTTYADNGYRSDVGRGLPATPPPAGLPPVPPPDAQTGFGGGTASRPVAPAALPPLPDLGPPTTPGTGTGYSSATAPGVGPAAPLPPTGVVPAALPPGVGPPSSVVPASGFDAPKPDAPTGGPPGPIVPKPPGAEPPAPGAGTASGTPTPGPAPLPAVPPAVLPETPKPAGPGAAPSVVPVPAAPAALPPTTGTGTGTPMTPAPPAGLAPPTAAELPKVAPVALPTGVDPNPPKPAALPDPPKPAAAAPMEFTKPPGGAAPAAATAAPTTLPVASERPPTSSFDEDVYEAKGADRYETVSKEFYGDPRFGPALQAYNRNQPLRPGMKVDVPPVHVLKKRYPQLVGGGVPVNARSALPPAGGDWQAGGSSPPADPQFRASRPRTYTVPAGGVTMRQVAEGLLGDARRWEEIYALNPSYPPDRVPAGAELKLPAGGRGTE